MRGQGGGCCSRRSPTLHFTAAVCTAGASPLRMPLLPPFDCLSRGTACSLSAALSRCLSVCVCVCARACVRACVCAYVRVCAWVCAWVCACVRACFCVRTCRTAGAERGGPAQGAHRPLRLRGGADPGWPSSPQYQPPPPPPQYQAQPPPPPQYQAHPPPSNPEGVAGGTPTEGPQGVPGFEHGFVDNGISYAEQFAAQLRVRRRMGHEIPVPTPDMFAGVEGVSFDANGNFQLGEARRLRAGRLRTPLRTGVRVSTVQPCMVPRRCSSEELPSGWTWPLSSTAELPPLSSSTPRCLLPSFVLSFRRSFCSFAHPLCVGSPSQPRQATPLKRPCEF